ncbi:MAG: FtsQ-type POTRA domain-containing protein [Clostridia bacterium]|nr:FtsQ-type POTRA domain-containing protein [Clostridia bacterium]
MARNEEYEEVPHKNGKRFAWFVVVIIIIAITTGCLFAPAFNIISVEAEDGKNVTSGEILEKAQIKLNENIFRISDAKIKKSIETLPYVKKAKIYRKLPNRISLKVEEREPYAIVKYLESFAITDKYGYVLEIKEENTMKELPIIYGINPDECISGRKLIGTSMLKYENSVYILETAEKLGFQYNFSEINYDDSTNVKLYIKENDIDIIYGEILLDTIEEKLGHLSSILLQLGDKKGKIDMSNEDYLARTVFTERK